MVKINSDSVSKKPNTVESEVSISENKVGDTSQQEDIIVISNLVKKYKDNTVVKGIDLKIKKGEVFGLLGPNGAGKSTTLNSILGLVNMTSGNVEVYGKDFTKHAKELKKHIGYVPQDFAFFDTMSALDNVKYWARVYGLKGSELGKATKEALDFTGLWERRKDKANKYSGGMKRRLNIACAIVHHPDILIMDEPTVGVDPQSRNSILEAIKIMNGRGTTVIYTSHYMEEIQAICDRVAIMDFGKIIAEGKIDALIESVSQEHSLLLGLSEYSDQILGLIKSSDGVINCTYEKDCYQVKIGKEEQYLAALLEKLMKNKIKILSMNIEKANLESVFLQLTGKKLRD